MLTSTFQGTGRPGRGLVPPGPLPKRRAAPGPSSRQAHSPKGGPRLGPRPARPAPEEEGRAQGSWFGLFHSTGSGGHAVYIRDRPDFLEGPPSAGRRVLPQISDVVCASVEHADSGFP